MPLYKAFRFELICGPRISRQLARIAGCVRFVYNKALALQIARRENGQNNLDYCALSRELTAWRHDPETSFLREAPSYPLQQTLIALTNAFRGYFEKRSKYPQFKKRGKHDSFRFPSATQYKLDEANSRICLPKVGWIRYRKSRNVSGKLRYLTVSRTAGKWYVSILTEHDVDVCCHASDSEVGIDLGVAMFATLSDGTAYAPVNSYRKCEKKLICRQRALARKEKFSSNWRKEQLRIQRIHSKIARIRSDYLQKLSSEIADAHSTVVLEDLRVQTMASSNKRRVKSTQVSRATIASINKSILDQGWGAFRSYVEFKQQWRGGRVVGVPPADTSLKCSACGFTSAANRKTQAVFTCLKCGHNENADLNAAKNILAAGHAAMACGANGAVKPSAAGTHRSSFAETAVGIPDASGRMSKSNASVQPNTQQFDLFPAAERMRFRMNRCRRKKVIQVRGKMKTRRKQQELWRSSDYDDEPRTTGKSAADLFVEACRAADEEKKKSSTEQIELPIRRPSA